MVCRNDELAIYNLHVFRLRPESIRIIHSKVGWWWGFGLGTIVPDGLNA